MSDPLWHPCSGDDVEAIEAVLHAAVMECQRRGFCGVVVLAVRAKDGGVQASMGTMNDDALTRLCEDGVGVLKVALEAVGSAASRETTVTFRSDA